MPARINGTELAFAVSGRETAPALILAHSLATTRAMWGPQLALLAHHYRVVAYDLKGHGESEAPKGAYSLEGLADDVAALAQHLGLARFSFMGLSIGGMIGQALALRHGHLLDKLVLCCTLTGAVDEAGKKGWSDRIAAVAKDGPVSQIEPTLARWLSTDFVAASPLTAEWIRDLIRKTPIDGYIGCGEAIKAMNLPAAVLGKISVPTLVLAGEKDPGATPAIADVIRARIPGAALSVVPGGLHLCNIEKPHEFNEATLGFLLGRK
jgi:3-oxoadipate enol-lactonase